MALGASRQATTAMRHHRQSDPGGESDRIVVGAKAVIRPKPPTRLYLSIDRGTAGKVGLPLPPSLSPRPMT